MAPRPKRKFEPDYPEPPMPTNQRGTGAGASAGASAGPSRRDIPTPETQELYNTMRELEEQRRSLGDHLQLQNRTESNDGHENYLQLPSPIQAPTSPGSLSCPSTTYSLTRRFEDTEIGGEGDQGTTQRRAMRHGPLGSLEKAQAALMRKLGACPECRTRRVKCTHFDRTLFEQEYLKYHARSRNLPPVSPSVPQVQEPLAAPSQPARFSDHNIVGFGSWQNDTNTRPLNLSGGQQDDAQVELDDLLQRTSSTPAVPAAPYYFAVPNRASTVIFAPQIPPTLPTTAPYAVPNSSIESGNQPILIGRTLERVGYECRYGEDGTSVLYFGACNQRYTTFLELRHHFEVEHAPVSSVYPMWKCVRMIGDQASDFHLCGFTCADPDTDCFMCGGSQWEERWYGTTNRTPSLTSGPSLRVGSQDGSTPGLHWGLSYAPYQNSTQGQSDSPFLGRYMGGKQGGSQHSFKDKPGGSKPAGTCFLGIPVYSQGCPLGRKCRGLNRPSEYFHKVPVPVLLFLSILSLLLFENWLRTGASLVGSKGIASAVLDVVRAHVVGMSLVCILAGLSGMWLFRHIRSRTGQSHEPLSCHRRCPARDYQFLGVSPLPLRLDIEDAGSIRGDNEMVQISG